MNKYKYNRKEWAMEFSKWLGFDDKYAEFDQDAKDERKWLRDLLAKEPESDKEKCPYCSKFRTEGICVDCDKDFTEKFSKPESDKESNLKKIGIAKRNIDHGDIIYSQDISLFPIPQEELEVEELDINISKLYGKNEIEVVGKLGKLIKAHNALVKEVKELKRKPQNGISCGGEGFSNGGDYPIPNGK